MGFFSSSDPIMTAATTFFAHTHTGIGLADVNFLPTTSSFPFEARMYQQHKGSLLEEVGQGGRVISSK